MVKMRAVRGLVLRKQGRRLSCLGSVSLRLLRGLRQGFEGVVFLGFWFLVFGPFLVIFLMRDIDVLPYTPPPLPRFFFCFVYFLWSLGFRCQDDMPLTLLLLNISSVSCLSRHPIMTPLSL